MYRLWVFLIVLSCYFTSLAQSCKVLFIGNSYTYVNNLPELVSSIYGASGDGFEYAMSAPGGCTFQQHCTISLPYIQQGDWDYVVLQEQSQLPSFPDAQFMQVSYPYAAELCELIRQYNPKAKIFFYMTWGRKNGDAQNCPYFPPLCTYEGMDSLLHARYMLMAEDNHTCVSPVGAVWHYVRHHYPEIELYQSDESHPAYLGSYIAACCFYSLFTGRNPLNITWNGTLGDDMANMAKTAVYNVLYDSLSNWCFSTDSILDDSTSVSTFPSLTFSLYPNPASNQIHIHASGLTESASVSIMDMRGNMVYHQTALSADEVLDISFLNNGFYLISVIEGLQRHTKILNVIH